MSQKVKQKLKAPNPVFFLQTSNEENAVPDLILKQARKSGRLNLSNNRLVTFPDSVLKLGTVHSEDSEVDIEKSESDDNYRWWELEPLKFLDMSNNSLRELPQNINELESLLTLLLRQNLIDRLPKQIGLLINLVKLDLAHNKLHDIPTEIGNLKELRNLNLSYNLFKKLPYAIYDLVMLNQLDLSNNELEEVEPGIGFLTRLTSLNLSQNKLSAVPSDISSCSGLKDLNLANNKLNDIGLPEFVNMPNIEIMEFQYNLISRLPKLRGCSNLKEIHLGFNKIEEVTLEELSTLSHLQVINLRDNFLQTIPKELSCLMNLVRLDLSNNNLRELPPSLSLLPHLESLLVEGNNLRTIRRDIIVGGTSRLLSHLRMLLPAEETEKKISNFPCANEDNLPNRYTMRNSKSVSLSSRDLCDVPDKVFEEAAAVPCNIVDLSKNKLFKTPSGIWILSKTLNDLNLSFNQLTEIPPEVGTCSNLRYLNLAYNKISSLPKELENCKRIRELNVSLNRLHEIPACVYELPALEILNLSDNKIDGMDAEKFLCQKYLTHLNLSNNNLSSVPPLMGNMTQLRNFGLDGNGLRALRPATIAKGTEAILTWLRDKIV